MPIREGTLNITEKMSAQQVRHVTLLECMMVAMQAKVGGSSCQEANLICADIADGIAERIETDKLKTERLNAEKGFITGLNTDIFAVRFHGTEEQDLVYKACLATMQMQCEKAVKDTNWFIGMVSCEKCGADIPTFRFSVIVPPGVNPKLCDRCL